MAKDNYRELFSEALSQVKNDMIRIDMESEFNVWFTRIYYIEDTENTITVTVPSTFVWNQLNLKGYVKKIEEKLKLIMGIDIKLAFKAGATVPPPPEKIEPVVQIPILQTLTRKKTSVHFSEETKRKVREQEATLFPKEQFPEMYATPVKPITPKEHPDLNENYTFAKFVPGENSMLAFKVCQAAAINPGKSHNPILIYGGVGLGKTHLMQAIGNYIYEHDKEHRMRICCITAETFTNEYITSVGVRGGKNTMQNFTKKYRNLDVLLVDDIHFLQKKEGAQAELFYTFEALAAKKKQMVFTCDRPIKELQYFEERLTSRFTRGMSVDLQIPNFETRKAILLRKLEFMGKTLVPEVIDYIAESVQTNVRDLESCLNRVLGFAEYLGEEPTLESVRHQLEDQIIQAKKEAMTMEEIIRTVARDFGVKPEQITGHSKKASVVQARYVTMYVMHKVLEVTLTEIGDAIGRDHSTVSYAISKLSDEMDLNAQTYQRVYDIINKIKVD